MRRRQINDNLYEVLKEIAQGVETHDHMEDEMGNVLVNAPIVVEEKIITIKDVSNKISQLEDLIVYSLILPK